MWQKLTVLFGLGIALTHCGDLKKKKEEKNKTTFDELLRTSDTKACNDRGFFYDTLVQKCDEKVNLAKWKCNRDGIESRISDEEIEKAVLRDIDAITADGYEFHQCGEADKLGYLIFIKKSTSGNTVSVLIKKNQLPLERTSGARLLPLGDRAFEKQTQD